MKRIRIRRLTDEGIDRFREYLEILRAGVAPGRAEVRALLTDSAASISTPRLVEADENRVFGRRFDLAAYLHELVPQLGLPDPVRDAGLWAWFALLWFDQVAPAAKRDGTRKPGEDYRYIPELLNFQTYYRHRVLGPYLIYSAHREDPKRALCMLCQTPPVHPDAAEQLASRQALIQSPALIGAATRLYYDPERDSLRRGSVDNRKPFKPGTLRRLIDVFWQLDRTYDHFACTPDAFVDLLPSEFRRFLKHAS